MSDEYKRGYGKGYQTGLHRSDKENAILRDVANQAAQRAERSESAQGIGHCEECKHWNRGDRPQAGWERCAWGICTVPRSAGTPHGTFICSEDGRSKIQTTPLFGCVLFTVKEPQ